MRQQPLMGSQAAYADTAMAAASQGQPPAMEYHGLAHIGLAHDPDSEPPETGYGFRPEEYNPDDFE